MSYAPNPAYPPQPQAPAPKRGRGLVWSGVICMVLAILIGGLALYFAFRPVFEASPQPISGQTTIQIEDAGPHAIYISGGGGFGSDAGCQVLGPDGAEIPVESPFGNQTLTTNGQTFTVYKTFQAAAGPHQVTCSESGVSYSVGPEVNVFGVVGLVLGGVFGGITLFVIGLILLIIGLVRK